MTFKIKCSPLPSCAATVVTSAIGIAIHPHALAIPITGMNLGIGEKGLILGLEVNPGRQDQLELGWQFAQGRPTSINAGLSSDLPIEIYSSGVRLAYNRYLNGRTDQAGPFLQAAISAQRLRASSVIDLEKLKFELGGATVTCSSCDTATFYTRSPAVSLIPAIGAGWQAILSRRLRMKAIVGIQYYKVPSIDWKSDRTLPKFARDEMKFAQHQVNQKIENLNQLFPIAGVMFTYVF